MLEMSAAGFFDGMRVDIVEAVFKTNRSIPETKALPWRIAG